MLSRWLKIGAVDVDSGQIMITDPCYLDDYRPDEFTTADQKRLPSDVDPAEFSYSAACVLTSNPPGHGMLFRGGVVVTATQCGDGSYPVFARFSGSEIAMVAVRFDLAADDEWTDPY